MCNRFALPASPEELAEEFEVEPPPSFVPRYNVAPGEGIWVVRRETSGPRVLDTSLWGVAPSWARGAGKPLLNIRAETLRGKPGRSPMAREGRLLVPAGGFYEWQRVGRARQPYYYRLRDSPLFALAALCETVPASPAGLARHCAILTTQPNALVAEVHDRMPVIVPREAYSLWLDPGAELGEVLAPLRPFPPELMTAYPVSTVVNRSGVEDPRAIEPAKPATLF
jgi:putative SOS response-associated peptidase YedK